MTAPGIQILLVEDNAGDARLLREALVEAEGFAHAVVHVERLAHALAALEAQPVDVILLDLTLPDASELDGLRRVHAGYPAVPIVVLTGLSDEVRATEAVQSGAQDYLVKGEVDARLITKSIRYAVERARIEEVSRQIAREQAANATVAAERARLHSLFMQAPAGICVLTGPSLTYELANARYLELVGKRALVGKPLLEAVPELAGQGFDTLLCGVMASGEAFHGKEVPCRLVRDGVAVDVLFDFVYEPMRGVDGVVEGIMVVATDVTEQVLARKRVEEARGQAALSEQKFQMLAEAIPQLVWSVNGDASDAYLSPRWYEYTGQAETLTLDQSWRAAIHPEDHERCLSQWAIATASHGLWQLEYRLRRHDGEYRWHLGRSLPHCAPDGTVLRWYGTATDIDAQRAAIRSRDDLLATVSHDLRGPLSAILLATEMLEEDNRGRREIAVIGRSVKRMERLIQDLLDMASIESGHLSVTPAARLVDELVDEAIDSIQPMAQAKTIALLSDIAGSQIPVHCDRQRVLQVFSNILGNAVKFTPNAGKISVLAHRSDPQFVRFAISDTGPGIEAEQLPFVFDRFWQAKDTAKAGTGLGLAICKGIIQQHGGSIWVESTVGVGTTFFFTLPVAPAAS